MAITPQALAERRQQLLREYEKQAESVGRLLSELEELDRLALAWKEKPKLTQTITPALIAPAPAKPAVEKKRKPTRPNPEALAALVARMDWFFARQAVEQEEARKMTTPSIKE